jgi:hypothetical protein
MNVIFDNGTHKIETSGVIAEPQAQPNRISKLAFLNRFTDAEYITIDLASIDNPSATTEQRQGQAMLRMFLSKIDKAAHINLDLQQTKDGVNALAAMGLLTTERATSILNDTITSEERP